MSAVRENLIGALVEEYMNNLLDNPEVVRSALEVYFDGFDNETLHNTLNGFMEN